MTTATPTADSTRPGVAARLLRRTRDFLQLLAPAADLIVRLYIAHVFFQSGLVKIQSWQSTLMLFNYEYHVPLLPPALAAWMAAFTELGASALFALGLGGRFAALWLFVFNIIAPLSYPDISAAGIAQHQVWGILILVILLHGPGKLSCDYWIGRWFNLRQPDI